MHGSHHLPLCCLKYLKSINYFISYKWMSLIMITKLLQIQEWLSINIMMYLYLATVNIWEGLILCTCILNFAFVHDFLYIHSQVNYIMYVLFRINLYTFMYLCIFDNIENTE